jgi:glycosyltransferase involved in cell wall biosynthesis
VKLLIYSHFFAPSIGGVETIVLSLARGLAELCDSNGALEFEITLVTQTPSSNYVDSALPFRVVRQPNLFELWRLIRSCDVLHVAGPALAPLSLGLLLRKPVVIEHHGFQTICPNGQLLIEPAGTPCSGHFMAGHHAECIRCNSAAGWLSSGKLWFLTFVRRILCARAAANIVPTEWLGGLLQLPRVAAIPHGLEFPNRNTRREPPSGKPVFAFLGRLVTTKGVRLLFDAAKILRGQNRSFELLIIGEGPERAALEQFVREKQLETQVHFAGHLDGQQIEAALACALALVVPSLGGEVFGLVVGENMARGLPIVASDLGAFTEVLGGAGLTFRTGDAADLAAALARLLDDPSLATALGHRARQRALDFCDRERMLHSHARVYRLAITFRQPA